MITRATPPVHGQLYSHPARKQARSTPKSCHPHMSTYPPPRNEINRVSGATGGKSSRYIEQEPFCIGFKRRRRRVPFSTMNNLDHTAASGEIAMAARSHDLPRYPARRLFQTNQQPILHVIIYSLHSRLWFHAYSTVHKCLQFNRYLSFKPHLQISLSH